MLVTKASERWIPLQKTFKTFPLFFFPPPFSASSFCILFAVYITAQKPLPEFGHSLIMYHLSG